MDFSEKWGTNVEEAVNLALMDLKLGIEDVDVTILEEPSKGFLGIGAKLAKVRVEKKAALKKESKAAAEAVPEEKEEIKKEEKRERPAKASKKQHNNYKEKESNDGEIEVVVTQERPADLVPVEEHAAITFLKDITGKMGLELSISAMKNEESLYIDIEGKDTGTIIGKRGQTLDAIQYLTSLVVNKEESKKYIRVVVDAENYRAKREKTLEQLANKLADKVVRTRKSVRLEPMNPYERKVIHATLQSNPKVTTRSEGEEPYRKVIIELK